MDDDVREGVRKNKPQQQLYRPGSGPLKKSPSGQDEENITGKQEYHNTMVQDPPRRGNPHGRHHHHNRGHHHHNKDNNRFVKDDHSDRRSYDNDEHKSLPPRRQDQQFYSPKFSQSGDDSNRSPSPPQHRNNNRFDEPHEIRSKRYSGNRRHDGDDFVRRDGRIQNSEPRHMSPPRKGMMENHHNRGRDTRSMDSSRHPHHSNGNKPPSGRRNSGMLLNIDSVPPRFRKQYLAKNGLSAEPQPDNTNIPSGTFFGQPSWSQTLPTRGRGRLREEVMEKDRLRFSHSHHLQTFESGSDSRSSTPHAPMHAPPPPTGRPPHFTGSQENIHSDKPSNYYHHNQYQHNDDYSNYQHQSHHNYGRNQNMNYSNKHHHNDNRMEGKNFINTMFAANRGGDVSKQPTSSLQSSGNNSATSEQPTTNRLLETLTSSIKSLTVECEQVSLDWAQEVDDEPPSPVKPTPILCQDLPGESNNRIQDQPKPPGADGRGGNNKYNNNMRPHGNGDHDRNNSNMDGRNAQGRGDSKSKTSGRNPRRRRRNGGVRKRISGNRSSSRGSQRRELSNEVPHRRTDRSPQSQRQLREFRDSFRDTKEQHHHNNEANVNRDMGRGHHYGRTDSYNDQDRPPSRNNWNRSQFSRENSRDRYSYSRASSGERAPYGSRAESRERQGQGRGGRADSEGFRLPHPPPMGGRSRNQNRRDSWTSRGSRHASVESGCAGDMSPPPSSGRGGGGGGGRRRRRRDSDNRHAGATPAPNTNWREEMQNADSPHDRRDVETGSHPGKGLAPGILVLPHDATTPDRNRNLDAAMDYHHNRGNPMVANPTSPQSQTVQRTLFNPSNPSKPIVVSQPMAPPTHRLPLQVPLEPQQAARPSYYDTSSESYMSSRNKDLIREVEKADIQLQWIFKNGTIVRDWDKILQIRPFLQQALKILLETDLKFCEAENVEHNFWKMLYYSYIEIMRKSIAQDEANKAQYKELINSIIVDGNAYFESLLELLQTTYKFKLEDYLNIRYQNAPKGSSYVSLALISAQKIYLFLGDLARYKELVNETTNYAKSKSWYTKAHQINPKNGRPYNQLAILAVYARRRLDAAYFYMRSLMSSNPCHSAQESLNALFDENRKKFETNERKRQAEKQKALDAAAASVTTSTVTGGGNPSSGWRGSLRKETWSRPGRTTTLLQPEKPDIHSDDEELANMTSVELNKRFVISYLHVHGKLITKIGMETFASSAGVMLRQFRALLRHSPLPINCGRLLQLTALNMFAIDTAYLKDSNHSDTGPVCRRALAVSLRMFGALLGRCCTLMSLPPPPDQQLPVHEDVLVILPALKVWSDWMLFHSSVWNPPPSSDDFDAGLDSDPWEQLAKLMNLLEPLDLQNNLVKPDPEEDFEMVRLAEDTQLSGFTPLMYGTPTNWYAPKSLEPEAAQLAARARALLFLGTTFLCGTDPPALERRLNANGVPEFISVVQNKISEEELERRNSVGDSDIIEASLSECEDVVEKEEPPPVLDWAACDDEEEQAVEEDEATKKLLQRRGELENKRQDLERRRLRMQSLMKKGQVSVELEVHPKYLVPDTNCFIDHLSRLQKIMSAEAGSPYTLVVPLVVVAELEGLTRAARVAEDAKAALAALKARRPALRFATTRGTLLQTPTFTVEKDGDELMTNDDKILNTSLCLCKDEQKDEAGNNGEITDGVRRLVREVVLLTEDRNLRVKALSRDLPVRDLPAFMRWADLD